MGIEKIQGAAAAAERVDMPDDLRPPAADAGPPEVDAPPPQAYEDETPAAAGALLPLTDYGNGQRLVLYYGENFLWVPRFAWFRWDGRRWAADGDEILVRRDAQQISERIEREIPCIALDEWQSEALALWGECRGQHKELSKKKSGDLTETEAARLVELEVARGNGESVEKYLKGVQKRHRDHARTSGNTGKISNMLTEARTSVAVPVDVLDAEPWMLCCENGILHFTWYEDEHSASWGGPSRSPQVDLLPHDRRHKITKLAKAKYDKKAKCPTWLAFLERVQPDPEMRAFLQRWFGYCLTGITTEQKLVFNYGGGRNGKSTAVDAIAAIVGDYSTTLQIESLTGSAQRDGGAPTPDLVRLPGARFVRSSEPEQGQKMKEALIKSATGGEAMVVRDLNEKTFDFIPEFKLTISGNYKPEVRGADDGIWRRIMLVPWLVQIPTEEVDPLLSQKLAAERDGILRWMVDGCLDWMKGGLRPPAVIGEATEDYRRESDPMRLFLETECEVTNSEADRVTAPNIRDAFNAWRLTMAEGLWKSNTVSRRMVERADVVKSPDGISFEKYRSNGQTGWKFLRLRETAVQRMQEFEVQIEDFNRRSR